MSQDREPPPPEGADDGTTAPHAGTTPHSGGASPPADQPTEAFASNPASVAAGSASIGRPRWLIPVIVGAVAVPVLCCAGFVAGAAMAPGDPEARTVVETATVTETIEVDPSDEREAELDDREAALDERDAALDEREAALQEWEDSLVTAELEIEAGTIPGDGIWVVGEDIEPGVYRGQGSGSTCYWARLRSLDGSDIISNHFGSASVSVEIHASDAAFETSGCGSWARR